MASLSSWMEPFLGLTTLKNCEDTFHTTFNTFNGVNGTYNVKHFTVAKEVCKCTKIGGENEHLIAYSVSFENKLLVMLSAVFALLEFL